MSFCTQITFIQDAKINKKIEITSLANKNVIHQFTNLKRNL